MPAGHGILLQKPEPPKEFHGQPGDRRRVVGGAVFGQVREEAGVVVVRAVGRPLVPGPIKSLDRGERQRQPPGLAHRDVGEVVANEGEFGELFAKRAPGLDPEPGFKAGLGGDAHGRHRVRQPGDGEVFQGVVDPLFRLADEVGLGVFELDLPRGHGAGAAFVLVTADLVVQLAPAVDPRHQKEREPLWPLGRPLGTGGGDGHVGEAGAGSEVFIAPGKDPHLSGAAGHGAIRPQVAAPLDLGHPGGAKGAAVEQAVPPFSVLGRVFMDGVGHLVGDGQDAVKAGVGEQIPEGVVVVPAPPFIGRADDRPEGLEQGALDRRQPRPVHPVSVEVVHHQNRMGLVVDVVGRLVDLTAHPLPPAIELGPVLGETLPVVREHRLQVLVELEVVLAVCVRNVFHCRLLPKKPALGLLQKPADFLGALQKLQSHSLELGDLGLDLPELRLAHLQNPLELGLSPFLGVVKRQDLPDLFQAEPEPATTEDEPEANPVALAVNPSLAAALGREEPDLLVITDRPWGHVEGLDQITDGIGPLLPLGHGLLQNILPFT